MSEKLSSSKIKLLEGLLSVYRKEVEVIYAVGVTWDQLKDEAKNQCVEDFDQAIIARETLLEEIADLKDEGIDIAGKKITVCGGGHSLREDLPRMRAKVRGDIAKQIGSAHAPEGRRCIYGRGLH